METLPNESSKTFAYRVTAQADYGRAHCGIIQTPHGAVETPNFVFCGTHGAIKGATMEQIKAVGAQIVLGNTYHLWLQPGPDIVQLNGGLHAFMGWDGPMLTDSGGFQIFSMGYGGVIDEIKGKSRPNALRTLLKITEDGAMFRSYVNGRLCMLTPERSVEIQQALGADFILPLDECAPTHRTRSEIVASTQLSHRWEERSLKQFLDHFDDRQRMYGIIQGGIYEDLRTESIDFIKSHPFFGQAIGGSLGVEKQEMYGLVDYIMQQVPVDRPTHLLGIGGLRDLLEGVNSGVDTFDCVHPTRIARHGCALIARPEEAVAKEHINLKNACYAEDVNPIDSECDCYTCRRFTRSYLHHLFKARESTGGLLLTIHNARFMMRWMEAIRQAIRSGQWKAFYQQHIHG